MPLQLVQFFLFLPPIKDNCQIITTGQSLRPRSPTATYSEPHRVRLSAALDARLESESLPLAPWY